VLVAPLILVIELEDQASEQEQAAPVAKSLAQLRGGSIAANERKQSTRHKIEPDDSLVRCSRASHAH
jgi:hypothetical protein